jgi:hypothetical protein
MRPPRLSEGVVRRPSFRIRQTGGKVRPMETVCPPLPCESDSDCTDDEVCPYCVNNECKANQSDGPR